jgi:MFS family permease
MSLFGLKESLSLRRWRWFAFLTICIFYSYEFFLRISPSMLVDQLLVQFHTTALGIAGFATSYFLGYLIMQIPAGLIYDRYSFRWVTAFGLFLCVFGTLIFTMTDQLFIAFVGRFILGCGSAFAFIGAITFVRKFLPDHYFTLMIAVVISIGTIAGAFGQVFAVKIIDYLSWHFTIDGMAIWGLILAIAILIIPKNNFIETKNKLQLHPIASIWNEIALVVKTPALWINGLIGSFLYLPTSILAAVWGLEFFSKAFHLDHAIGSVGITLLFVGWAIGGPIFSMISQRFAHERLILIISALLISAILFWLLSARQMSAPLLLFILILFGLISSAQVLVWKNFTFIFPDKSLVGTASSFTNLIIMLSIAVWDLGIGQFINMVHHVSVNSTEQISAHDLRIALYVLPVLVLLVPVLSFFLPKNKI